MAFWRRRSVDPLPEDWEELVARRVPAWWDLPVEVRTDVRDVAEHLLATKRWEAAAGFDLTVEARVVIAAQAALPVIGLGALERSYPNVRSIIVHADAIPAGERKGPVEGTYVDDEDWSSGEAGHDDEPIVLAWSDVVWDLRHPRAGQNVVVHEFAHKLDMLDGTVDGMPPLASPEDRDRWIEVCTREYDAIDEQGDDHLLGDYAGEDPGEFFSVASEVFFTRPQAMASELPDLYDLLARYFRQDPAAWVATEI
ncbi:zinc-dependent peptidase [Aquihabitans daechungensis]|uniref:M90 family metallopeptidase n=1 Tax=Aquihabitans daechungensis TaxID=1052257 RepID=UPI003BA0D6B7